MPVTEQDINTYREQYKGITVWRPTPPEDTRIRPNLPKYELATLLPESVRRIEYQPNTLGAFFDSTGYSDDIPQDAIEANQVLIPPREGISVEAIPYSSSD